MPRRREFGLFKLDVNADVVMVFKGSIGEINRWSKGKGLAFRRDAKNIFGGYWVDESTGDAFGVDVIAGRKGQARNPASEPTEADRNWQEYWHDHYLTAAKIYKSIRKHHPDSDEEMIEEETANILMGLHDSPIRTAVFDEDIASDLAWIARHTVERPKEFLAQNPADDDDWELGPSNEYSLSQRFALKIVSLAEEGVFDTDYKSPYDGGATITSSKPISTKPYPTFEEYVYVFENDSRIPTGEFLIRSVRIDRDVLAKHGVPWQLKTSSPEKAFKYLMKVYEIKHASGSGKRSKNPSDDPLSALEFAQDVMALKRREGPSVDGKFALAESGFGVSITSARKIGPRRIKYVDIVPTSGGKFQVTGYAGSDARLKLLGYPKVIHTSDANEVANYLSSIYAIRHAPGTRR